MITATDRVQEAQELIAEQIAEGGQPCVTSSFQAECVALVHMVTRALPDIPVLFLDTGYHFPETYTYRDEIARLLNLNVVNLAAEQSVADQETQFGILNQTAPDRCCGFRKVGPLFGGLAGYDVWFTGLRRDQSPTRANLQTVEPFKLPVGKVLRKVSPLAMWSTKEVWDYMRSNHLPLLSLYDQGYTSIGCAPCTTLPLADDNARSGRWGGKKLECGIHIQAE